ncbi:MAG: prepilin-type N-terminal cleavage/methylation domain-containing protein [Sulfurimonas sp.]|nr:prepilin-type N-terminal cleavage/methylation domain-containing protein [Sulfurimonas sp.]
MKNAFTMIEMIFVIVVLGILAAIAVPKFAATRTDAEITKGRADIASIRSAIVTERQGRLIQGQSGWITALSQNTTTLFDGNGTSTLLMYGVAAGTGSGHWQSTDGTHYTFKILDTDNTFVYDPLNGTFLCTAGAYCSNLVD